jgi:hypothetical protein
MLPKVDGDDARLADKSRVGRIVAIKGRIVAVKGRKKKTKIICE